MNLFYGRDTGTIEQANDGWLEDGEPVSALAQPGAVAMASDGREAALGPIWCVVRHDGACLLTLTPIVDDVVRDDLATSYQFAKQDDDIVRNEIVRLHLSEPQTFEGVSFGMQAVRGQWLTVRAELTPSNTEQVRAGLDPDGNVYGIGGLAVETRPLGVSGTSIPSP